MTVTHTAIQLACRNRARGLVVATTGLTSLSATATGFARTSGSFLTDGFAIGMEVKGVGFSADNNAVRVITDVKTEYISAPGCTAQSATSGRSLTVGLPSRRAWEGKKFTPDVSAPYVEEHYIRGPMAQKTGGPNGDLEWTPMYALHVYVPEDTDILADGGYADALTTLFAPRTPISISGGAMWVRWETGPYSPGRMPGGEGRNGWVVTPITFPLLVRSPNTI